MKRNIVIIFFVSSIALFIYTRYKENSNIIEADNIDIVVSELEKRNEKSLVVFDCDDVLIRFKDKILNYRNRFYLKTWIIMNYFLIDKKLKDDLYSIVCLSAEPEYVNSKMPKIVKSLQNRFVKTVVLTSTNTGELGRIPDMVDWRIKTLKKMGYYFGKGWEDLESIKFTNLRKNNRIPEYKDGILFACSLKKSVVLNSFLETTKFKPNKIIFIDDRKDHLIDVGILAKKLNIDYIGINYIESEKSNSNSEFSIKKAFSQLNKLRKNHVWTK
ncbi:MAG: DUF2608 domain-containing protein [Holosporales bacterium]|jgi:FMN phosphatase YigB (HAD superfamily)|nr:DUF2608 domain-containing protein [Holosporales bacterium]